MAIMTMIRRKLQPCREPDQELQQHREEKRAGRVVIDPTFPHEDPVTTGSQLRREMERTEGLRNKTCRETPTEREYTRKECAPKKRDFS